MRKLVGVLFAGLFLVALARPVLADDDDKKEGPNFTFGAAASYVFDINDPDSNDPTGINPLSYANQEPRDEAFNIDLVQLGVNGSRGNASYGAKLDYGDLTPYSGDSGGTFGSSLGFGDGRLNIDNVPGVGSNGGFSDGDIGLQTAFLSYDFGGAGITAGRFDTPIGYEVLEPWGNANISRSYTWSLLQPKNHDGVFVSGNVDVIDAMLGVVNGFSVNENSNGGLNDFDDEKGIVGAVGAGISDALNLYFSSIYTEDKDIIDTQLYNAIVSGKVPMNGSGFRYALEGNYRLDDQDEGVPDLQGEARQWSIVAYLGGDFGPTSLDLRGEYLDQEDDPECATPGCTDPDLDAQTWDITATAGWYVTDGLQFRIEYRHDDVDADRGGSGVDVFGDDDGTEDALDTVQAQVVWYPEL